MKHVSKWLLRAVTAAVPVAIAACYGMAVRYTRAGRVVDARSAQGVEGVSVTCLARNAPEVRVRTATDGAFSLRTNGPCDELRVEDVDGAEHGSYRGTTIPFPEGGEDIRVALEPAE